MADEEDFTDLGDILNRWASDGPREGVHTSLDITVYLKNGPPETFVNAELDDIGARIILTTDERMTVYPEASILMYEVTAGAVEESDDD